MHTRKTKHEPAENVSSDGDESTVVADKEASSKEPFRRFRNRLAASTLPAALMLVVVMVAVIIYLPSNKPAFHGAAPFSADISSSTTSSRQTKKTTAASTTTTTPSMPTIPECTASPWKPDENMVGTCPGTLQSVPNITTATACAASCCAAEVACIIWQFRRDVGCLQGPDARLGMEKHGPAAYCSGQPPVRWHGQFVLVREGGRVVDNRRDQACRTTTWNPHEQPGQCFGLGDVRPQEASVSARACMEACCAGTDMKEPCGAWQWEARLGCFYGPRMFSCAKSDDPVVFEPFVGRRKLQASRSYTGADGKPWKQVLQN